MYGFWFFLRISHGMCLLGLPSFRVVVPSFLLFALLFSFFPSLSFFLSFLRFALRLSTDLVFIKFDVKMKAGVFLAIHVCTWGACACEAPLWRVRELGSSTDWVGHSITGHRQNPGRTRESVASRGCRAGHGPVSCICLSWVTLWIQSLAGWLCQFIWGDQAF